MRGNLHTIKKICVLTLLIFIGVVVGLSQTDSREKQDASLLPEGAQYLPDGEGRMIMLKACVQCHDLRNTASQRKSSEGWRHTINEMIWRGTPLVGEEAEIVTHYLAKVFGPDKPSTDLVKRIFSSEKVEKAREIAETKTTLVNLNTASLEELTTLPGVGHSEATAILDFRRKYGSFKSINDLDGVKGISQNVKRAVKKLITTKDPQSQESQK